MISPTYFFLIFVFSVFVSVAIILILNRNSTPLKKAYNVYFTMSILHMVLFGGIILTLPYTFPSLPMERYNTAEVETIKDIKEMLAEQRADINEIRNNVRQIEQLVQIFALIFLLFVPIIYYNLFKYNLEIEKLSGKSSFD